MVIKYIENFLGFVIPSIAEQSFNTLHDVMTDLGVTGQPENVDPAQDISFCLGILVDTVEDTLSIPEDKLH